MKSTLRTILLWALRKLSDPVSDARDRLVCSECGAPIRKRDKHRILAVRHVNCKDPRMVEPAGQLTLRIEGDTTNEKI